MGTTLSMKKLLLLLLILPFIISCQKESNKLTDIENITFENFSVENFYKTYHILDSKKVNIDSLRAYNRDTLIGGSYELKPFDAYPKTVQSYPDYLYYTQIQASNDHFTEKDLEEKRVFGVTPVKEIAFFHNIKFNYANFIVDKKNNKVNGCSFITRNHAEADYYKKSLHLIREKLGKPKFTYKGFIDDNGGPVHYPLIYDIWFLKGKMFQFSMNQVEEGAETYESITLLILNENLTDTFDSSLNMNFTIFKDYFEEERASRLNLEVLLTERVGKENYNAAREKAKRVLDSIKRQR